MKKEVEFDIRAQKEIENFPAEVPCGKRLTRNIYEMRINHIGAWRVLYSYVEQDEIIVLLAFHKKSQKTPNQIINLAIKRLKQYA